MYDPPLIQILHVDDDAAFASLTAEMLENEDERFTVTTELSATEGLDRLAEDDIDCIVSDYNMPGRDGIEFLERVRENYPDLPFILFTGQGSEEVASEAISAGVTDYLQKASGTERYELLANRIDNAVRLTRAQRERQRHLDAIETTREGIAIFNEDGEFSYVNEAFADLYGYETEEMIGERWELIYRDEDIPRVHNEIIPSVEENGHWRGETIGIRADGSTFIEDHTLASTEEGERVCTVQDITEQKDRKRELEERERRYRGRLNALHSATRELVMADTPEGVAESGIVAASNILDLSISTVFFESDGELEPVASSEDAEELFNEIEPLERDEAVAWEVYESGEPLHTTDVTQLDSIHNPDTPISSEMIVPLADHGVLLAGRRQEAAFDESDFTLAQILGKNIGTALDRVAREQELRAQE